MIRLKLPRTPLEYHGDPLPPGLRWDVPRESVTVLLGRREFLKALALVLAALALPVTRARRAIAAARGTFLTPQERTTLEALCDRIIPPDTSPDGTPSPGAKELGAATYIDRMLAAFTFRVPLIYAGGPFSNRNPFPDPKRGIPSHRRPRNAFKRFIPLTRVQEIRWRAEIFGSSSPDAPGAAFNDAALGPLVGLQQTYRDGLARVDQIAQAMAGAPYAQLSTAEQDRVLKLLDAPGAFPKDARRDARFPDILIEHTLEGCFAPPEYGGNKDLGGWKMIGLEGDDQPLGYSIFDRTKDDYNERPDHPMSTPNPDEIGPGGAVVPRPLSAEGEAVQEAIASVPGD